MKWYEIDIYEKEDGELVDRLYSTRKDLAMGMAKAYGKLHHPERIEINRCFGERTGETFEYDYVELVEVL